MKFALVRREPSETTWRAAWPQYHPWRENSPTPEERPNNFRHMKGEWGHVFSVLLSANEEPTPEELDELCHLYETTHKHGPADHWERNADGSWTSIAPLHERRRNEDRSRMRAFIKALGAMG